MGAQWISAEKGGTKRGDRASSGAGIRRRKVMSLFRPRKEVEAPRGDPQGKTRPEQLGADPDGFKACAGWNLRRPSGFWRPWPLPAPSRAPREAKVPQDFCRGSRRRFPHGRPSGIARAGGIGRRPSRRDAGARCLAYLLALRGQDAGDRYGDERFTLVAQRSGKDGDIRIGTSLVAQGAGIRHGGICRERCIIAFRVEQRGGHEGKPLSGCRG